MSDYAIVTLAIGEKTQKRWDELCKKNWNAYSKKYGIDIIVIDSPLDVSDRAKSRSPAWQKCLVFSENSVQKYKQIAWFDVDIFFNNFDAPNLFNDVPIAKVGAVDSFIDPSYEENQVALERLWNMYPSLKDIKYKTPGEIYLKYGNPIEPINTMINSGVMVASPSLHANFFRVIYNNYEDKGANSYYENVPLSYEICNNNLLHALNPKFNHLWTWSKLLHYPFLMQQEDGGLRKKITNALFRRSETKPTRQLFSSCANAALNNCYCLHFAGYASEMKYVNLPDYEY